MASFCNGIFHGHYFDCTGVFQTVLDYAIMLQEASSMAVNSLT